MKKLLSLFLTLAMRCCLVPAALAADSDAKAAADTLNQLGLFQGTGTNADGTPRYELDRAPSRNEAVTMLVRLLGAESAAMAGKWETPFTDVPDWAKPYVGYAYANKLTNGTSATTFSGGNQATVSQYLTFVLRALGYESGTDFEWDKAWELSDKLGITKGAYNAESAFLRGDVAKISLAGLAGKMKDGSGTLADKLIKDGAFTREAYDAAMAGKKPLVLSNGGVKLTVPAEYADLLIAKAPEKNAEGVLFTVSEKASVEAAKALGEEYDGAGWLFDIARISEDELHQKLCNDMSGQDEIGRDDNGGIYMLYRPTDVRLVRENNEEMMKATEQWSKLNEWAGSVGKSFIAENPGLVAETRTNTELDIYLNRLAYMPETKYTLSTLDYGPLNGDGFDATLYLEKLVNGVTYEVVDEEAPDGEYAVLSFPEDDIRFDFFFAEGKENYIRQVWNEGKNELLYKANFDYFELQASKLMHDWYNELADFTGANMGYTPDDLVGKWAEKIAGRCQIEITKSKVAGEYDVTIHWGSSAWESSNWTMTAKGSNFPVGRMSYDNAKLVIRTYSSETEYTDKVQYENGTGEFYLNSANELIWIDNVDHAAENCVFVSVD